MERPKTRRLYYISDLHLELMKDEGLGQVNILPVEGDVENFLALCGDIGNPFFPNYEKLLKRHFPLYKRIFIISGNHEYYTSKKQKTIEEVDLQIRKIAALFPNVTFLTTNEPFLLDDVMFIGCTLWTEVDGYASRVMNDYNRIYTSIETPADRVLAYISYQNGKKKILKPGRRLIRPLDISVLHGDMLTYIEESIETCEAKKIIILTHHAPSFKMTSKNPSFSTDLSSNDASSTEPVTYSKYYATNLEYLFKSPVICWISGHTHNCIDEKINDIPCLSNCYGYPGQKTGVNIQKYFEF